LRLQLYDTSTDGTGVAFPTASATIIDDFITSGTAATGGQDMTTTAEDAPRAVERSKRRIIVAGLAATLIVGCLVTVGTLRHLDHQYGPPQSGAFGGVYSDRGFVFGKDGTSYRLADPPGATAELIGSIDDRGAHSVRITSVDRGGAVGDVRWSVYRLRNGGAISGEPTPWHGFPAVVPAHGTIRLLITIHHPDNCAADPTNHDASLGTYDGGLTVHWESLLHSHTSRVYAVDGENIRVC
jgi:hypothetical protein